MELLLIRHGEMAGDPFCRPPAGVDGCLSAAGERQAADLGRALAHYRVDRVNTSPSGRARQTAETAFGQRGIPIEVLDGLHEWLPNRDLERIPSTTLERMHARVEALPADRLWQTELGESTLQLLDRVGPPFCARLAELGVERRHGGYVVAAEAHDLVIAVVAHGGSLGALATFLLGLAPFPVAPFDFGLTGVLHLRLRRRGEVHYPAVVATAPGAIGVEQPTHLDNQPTRI